MGESEEFLTGVRKQPRPDRVLATILVTDLVASTDRAAACGDEAWRELMARHDALVADQPVPSVVQRPLSVRRGRSWTSTCAPAFTPERWRW